MRQRRADDAVDRRPLGDLAEPELVQHARRRNLSGRMAIPGVRPGRMKVRGQHAGRQCRPPPYRSAPCSPARSQLSSRRLSASERVITATLTTSAPPRASRARARQVAGTPSKSCVDKTMRLPPVDAISSRQSRLELDVDVFGALLRARSRESRFRSASLPSNAPPSHSGRQVTITGRRPAGHAPRHVRIGHRVQPQLDQIGARATASRRRRSSAIVGGATVTTSSGLDIKKASSTVRLKRLCWLPSTSVSGQGSRPFSLGVIPPSKTKRHGSHATTTGRGDRLVDAFASWP